MLHFYTNGGGIEYCFNVQTSEPLELDEIDVLLQILADGFLPENISQKSRLNGQNIVELGPRLNFETADSSNAVAIFHACGLTKITRVEKSRRYLLLPDTDKAAFIAANHDRMTECPYPESLQSFATGAVPEKTFTVDLITGGVNELRRVNHDYGLGMDEQDFDIYMNLFTKVLRRNPTNVELFMLGNNNSEHSRHWFFKGNLVIDGEKMPYSLLQIIKSTLEANPANSVIAFNDNSSVIEGYSIDTLLPKNPGTCSPFEFRQRMYHILFTAETHNYPSGISPFQGATTGTGGRIRDGHATGRGSLVIAGTAGYCTAALNILGYCIPGEPQGLVYPCELASPLSILIEASNGASDYGNKFGEPVIQGFVRTFEQILPSDERRGWIKPIMFTGGIGQIDEWHVEKEEPKQGMLIVQVGGPAYRVGVGGGSASSMVQGENIVELDFNAVQRGNAEMENKLNRVIRACVEMRENNPILVAHDQGAGGPGNVITETINPAGGLIDMRKIKLGDPSLSDVEIWCAEYQERCAFLIHRDRIDELEAICQREKVGCEVLGYITGDGMIAVFNEVTDDGDDVPIACVDLPLDKILGKMPPKTYELQRIPQELEPLRLPENLTVEEGVRVIFIEPSVGSKGYLVRKVDRSVTGLIAQQQCCGPLQLPVADVAVVAQSHFGLTGGATAIGEQPIKMLVNEKAGARMAVGEMLTNMASVVISHLSKIKCSLNWMWPAKLPGEGARVHDAAVAVAKLMKEIGIAVDGGKDSLSMAAKIGDETVKAPGQMVVSGYVTVPDITQKVTPDIKRPGESKLLLIDIGEGRNRLGGSALAQAFGQIGDESPDVDNPFLLVSVFNAIQVMIEDGLILSCHDRSDGGLITTLAEMVMAGNCGATIKLPEEDGLIPQLFSEELGLVLEYLPDWEETIKNILTEYHVSSVILGNTEEEKRFFIGCGNGAVLDVSTDTLLSWWEATSDCLEQEQMNPEVAKEQASHHIHSGLRYYPQFAPEATPLGLLYRPGEDKPKVAILREEGSNGDREMTSAFFWAGFEPWDVTMTDLLEGRISLDQFRGAVFVGGFSYADVLGPGKGWASVIKDNTKLWEMFRRFFEREDTFSLGICNGCQLMTLLGVVPWQGIPGEDQPRFIQNTSERFESHWGMVGIYKSPSIMLRGMEGSILGIWSAHGGGRLYFPNQEILDKAMSQRLVPISYVDNLGRPTEKYRFNPNGSPYGIAGFCSLDGRHLAMMPHPERAFLLWQWPWLTEEQKEKWGGVSPWMEFFRNARLWCEIH